MIHLKALKWPLPKLLLLQELAFFDQITGPVITNTLYPLRQTGPGKAIAVIQRKGTMLIFGR
jgi:hypothetical protein